MSNSTDEVLKLPSVAPDQQYVLSLDSLDSNFVCQYAEKTSNAVKPLWSKSKMDGESTFCHVEKVPEMLDDQDYLIPFVEVYMCSVCNFYVPRSHSIRHRATKAHQLFAKMTERILANVTNQLEKKKDSNSDEEVDYKCTYYCETCSGLILTRHVQKHNMSKLHAKCIEDINLAKRFFKLYRNGSGADPCMKVHKVVLNGIRAQNFDISVEGCETDDSTSTSVEDDSETVFKKNGIVPSEFPVYKPEQEQTASSSSSSDELLETSKEMMLCFELYLKEKKQIVQNFKMPIIEMNSVVVVTPKGYKAHIPFDKFHSYKRVNIAAVYCQICRLYIKNNFIKLHNASTEHINNIMLSVNDCFQRKMVCRSYMLISRHEDLRHCLLCNETVWPSFHKECFASLLKNDSQLQQVTKSNKGDKTFCTICEVDIDTHNYINHTKGSKHQKKMHNKASADNTQENPAFESIMKEISPEGRAMASNLITDPTNITVDAVLKLLKCITSQKNKTYCPTCDVHIDTHNFTAHTKAPKHKNKLKNTKMTLPDDNKSNVVHKYSKSRYCNTCQVYVPKDGMDTHLQGKLHRNKSGAPVSSVGNVSANKKVTAGTSEPVRGKQSRSQRRKMRELLAAALSDSEED